MLFDPPVQRTGLVYCITCKGRVQHIEQTLPENLRHNPTARFVLLNYNSPDHLNDYLRTNHKDAIDRGQLIVYHFRDVGPFRMAHAKNMAHRLGIAEGGILVNLDADNFTGEGLTDWIEENLTAGSFLWSRMVKDQTPRGISGRIAVHSDTFLKVGGYDERFSSWSPDDKDFNQRLREFGCEAREIPRKFLLAVLHTDKMRFKEYPNLRKSRFTDLTRYEPDVQMVRGGRVVVNAGRFGMGVVYRNFGNHPIILNPIPSRVFGIGMHKTATTSLHTAMTLLGFDSAHWKSAHWAKRIWEEMTTIGYSRTVEQNDFVCDLPLPLLFRQLDLAYPGSKFILTERDEIKWLSSIVNHWSDKNPFRKQWDSDPFTHKVHTLLYGRRSLDGPTFLQRYRRHNEEVKEYFRSRPQDLLVMQMDKGAGWSELCTFLGLASPELPYPTAFQTNNHRSPQEESLLCP